MNRKALVVVAAALAALVVTWQLGWLGKKPIFIGVVLPLTGPDAAAAAGMRNAIRMAVDETNAKGGVQGRRVEVLEVDDHEDQPTAKAAAARLAADARVLGVTGYFNPAGFWASHDTYVLARMPLVLSGLRARESTHLFGTGDQEFSLLPLGPTVALPIARWAWDTAGARKHLYVREGTFDGQSEVNIFRGALTTVSGTLVSGGDERVAPDATDFSPVLEQLRARGSDLVFYGGRARQAALLVKQLRAAGLTTPFVLGAHEPAQEFLEVAKEAAEGAVTGFPDRPLEDTQAGRAFLEKYLARGFAEPPGRFALLGYAGAQTLLAAMEKSFLTRPSVGGSLKNELFQTALGPVKYYVGGSTWQPPGVVYQVKGGRWVPVLQLAKDGKTLLAYPP